MSETQVKVFSLDCRLGTLWGAVSPRGLCALGLPSLDARGFALLLDRRAPGAHTQAVEPGETLAGRQLMAYVAGSADPLDAPLDLEGLTAFSRQVMELVRAIPRGRTATYGDIAARAGRPGAARAVGQVMHRNPVPLFVPCHRVLGADGSLTGFAGGLDAKRALLDLEAGGKLFS